MRNVPGHDVFRILAIVAVTLTYLTILLGGNVAASDSGLACPTWPSCNGTFTPVMTGGVSIEWAHRLSAFVLSMSVVVLFALALTFERRRRALLGFSGLALVTVAAQALMGGVVVLSDLSPWAVVIHLGLATALFAILVLVALLANLRDIPRRWVDWLRSASVERPVTDRELGRPGPLEGPAPRSHASSWGAGPPGLG